MTERKIAAMHKVYGKDTEHTCADCDHLVCYMVRSGRRFYKCLMYGNSSSVATDWPKRGIACKLWGKPDPGDYPLLERIKHEKRQTDGDEPIPGQIDMFGGVVNEAD